jgi:hypothetical protein
MAQAQSPTNNYNFQQALAYYMNQMNPNTGQPVSQQEAEAATKELTPEQQKVISEIAKKGTRYALEQTFGSTAAPASLATAGTQAAYGGNALASGAANVGALTNASYGGNAALGAADLGASTGGLAVQSSTTGGVNYAAGMGSGGSGAASASGGTPMASVGSLSYAGYLAAAAQLYNAAKNWKNVADEDKALEVQRQAALAVANAYTAGLASVAYGFARKQWGGTMAKFDKLDKKINLGSLIANDQGWFGSKKADQQARDKIRKELIKSNVITPDWQVTFKDGSKFDVGKDGGARLMNADGTERRYREIDFAGDKRAGQAVGRLQALAPMLGTKGGDKLDMTGYFTNAVLANSKDDKEALDKTRQIYSKFGINDVNDAYRTINKLQTEGAFDENMGHVYRNAFLNDIFKGQKIDPVKSSATYNPANPTGAETFQDKVNRYMEQFRGIGKTPDGKK